ncbi:MAG: phage late control D family protein [Gemmatimonadales bacterium]
MLAQPKYVPAYALRINGKAIPSALRASVTSVRYEDGTQSADRVEVGIANVDLRWLQQHIRGLGFRPFPTGIQVGPVKVGLPPDGLFDVDNMLELSLGYADTLEHMFTGEITGVEASFPSDGVPTMTLVAHDYLHRMAEGSSARGFGPLPDAVIAMILAAEHRLIPVLDPAIIATSTGLAVMNYYFGGAGRKQKGQSDLDFLKEIAAQYDADFWIEGDTLYLSRYAPKAHAPQLTLRWGESLLEFSPKVNTIGRVEAAAMKFTLREIPASFLVSVFFDFDREVVGVKVEAGEGGKPPKSEGQPTCTAIDQPVSSPTDLVNSALVVVRELRTKLNNRLTGTGSAVGDPRIRAGAAMRLEGLGPSFSGDYRVVSASHAIDTGGYRTTFEVRKEILP